MPRGKRTEPSAPAPPSIDDLGRTLRTLRRRKGLTLVQVAERSGCSHSLVSQIERGVTRPSMETLHRVAHALGTTAQAVLAASATDPVSVVRVDEGVADIDQDGSVRALVRGERELQPLEFVNAPTEWGAFYEHAGAEILFVIAGRVEAEVEGRPTFFLGPRDTAYWAGGVRHRWRQVGDEPVHALLVLANEGASQSPVESGRRRSR